MPKIGWYSRASVFAAVMVLACAGCSSTKSSTPAAAPAAAADSVQIHGNASDPVNKIVIKAIADLQTFWEGEFPKLYGHDYTPVKGGFYAVTPSSGQFAPCAQAAADISGNAFYCSKADDVAWDVEKLLPDLRKRFGDFVIPVVLAHEWGHAIQARADFQGPTVVKEIQADCFAGAWAAHAAKTEAFKASEDDLDNALAGFLFLRDEPGTEKRDPQAHGSGFDRVNSFRTGFDNGAGSCKGYKVGDPPVVEIPFTNAADVESGGNAPYEDIISGVPNDLEDYWSQVYPKLTGQPWTPLQPARAFNPADPPTCGGQPTSDYVLFYCVPEDYVGFDAVKAMPQIYDQGGDFAVATLIATQYGLAVLAHGGQDATDKLTSLRADCMAGAWAASILLEDRPESAFKMSPGDLDKGITALIVFRGSGDVARQGHGSVRVDAYRDGVMNGAKACVTR
ncbi:neutral zinc metallopeptidase [Mycobacterium paraterrae]|uniref:Neutral zinc metallopeptidase n=1 Tax=Mycobacterium paraterrae TaxID=577492 RepID=A0ABY3VDY6_9MYCO|nr:neutral zinc metallopeptidase [Mycobacterium paraterrae]UMB67644.1 neutral zinc metallopeptidase [Mycobacterium paraterrae]